VVNSTVERCEQSAVIQFQPAGRRELYPPQVQSTRGTAGALQLQGLACQSRRADGEGGMQQQLRHTGREFEARHTRESAGLRLGVYLELEEGCGDRSLGAESGRQQEQATRHASGCRR
jgi:hypothetical protein